MLLCPANVPMLFRLLMRACACLGSVTDTLPVPVIIYIITDHGIESNSKI
jgi:hypothetical protein